MESLCLCVSTLTETTGVSCSLPSFSHPSNTYPGVCLWMKSESSPLRTSSLVGKTARGEGQGARPAGRDTESLTD